MDDKEFKELIQIEYKQLCEDWRNRDSMLWQSLAVAITATGVVFGIVFRDGAITKVNWILGFFLFSMASVFNWVLLLKISKDHYYQLGSTELLSKLGEKRLAYLFSWDEIPGSGDERLVNFLKKNFDLDWVRRASIEKIDPNTIIVKTAYVKNHKNYISLSLDNKKTKVDLKIDEGISDEFAAELENGKLNIYLEYDWRIHKPSDYFFKKQIKKKRIPFPCLYECLAKRSAFEWFFGIQLILLILTLISAFISLLLHLFPVLKS